MGAMIRFGADGWRARLDGDFTQDNVVRVADAVGSIWSRQSAGALVYVGFDMRPDAESYARLAGKVLSAHGLHVKVSNRYVPTPALSWTVARDDRAVGGMMITGSHSPNDYQGIKLRMSGPKGFLRGSRARHRCRAHSTTRTNRRGGFPNSVL